MTIEINTAKAIATCGIWLGTAYMAKYIGPFVIFVALIATIATTSVWGN